MVDRFDDLKERWCRFWVADEELSRYLDEMDRRLDREEAMRDQLKKLRP